MIISWSWDLGFFLISPDVEVPRLFQTSLARRFVASKFVTVLSTPRVGFQRSICSVSVVGQDANNNVL